MTLNAALTSFDGRLPPLPRISRQRVSRARALRRSPERPAPAGSGAAILLPRSRHDGQARLG
jgi:hypothetical protein